MNSLTRYKILGIFIHLSLLFTILTFVFNNYVLGTLALISIALLCVVIHDMRQTKHALLRNYPLIARLRWFFEDERAKIQQYFIEHDTNGTPYNREKRSDVYQKAKGDINTTPFGTQLDVYEKGYEFIKHSMFPKDISEVENPRVTIGSKFCKKPYSASIFNISAMSYGALSNAAVNALNGGAKLGDFFHNTGEGGVSPYHSENGGDLCYQIGTGYFGAGQTIDGKRQFNPLMFTETLKKNPSIKMVEIKLSQGAKPGHGGILPASKNTQEIANIRGIEPHVDVMSPPYHSAFTDSKSMLNFVSQVRELSDGLPIGIKLCVGDEYEIETLFTNMKELDIYPDFITVDGGEGGTGAAPIVFTNNIGMPLIDGLKIVNSARMRFGLKDEIKIIASGKASTSFDIIKLISMGADTVNAARAFMFSLGCIQARECNKNTCPVGIATQNKELIGALNPAEKKVRVYNFHKATIHEIREVLAAMGLTSTKELKSTNVLVRNNEGILQNY
jgi:glutamate synthase domain-containing protein 2